MLLKLLSDHDRKDFIEVAELLILADKPLLWDGKLKDEITPQTNISKISIKKSSSDETLLEEAKAECRLDTHRFFGSGQQIEDRIVERLRTFPLHKIEEPETRLTVASSVLREILKGKKSEMPAVPKLMLFELMLLALAGGRISNVEWRLLNDFKHHYQVEDYIFEDLLKRAEITQQEINKTLSIVLE